MASILITTPAANNVAFPAVVSGTYSLQNLDTALGGGGGDEAIETGSGAPQPVVLITVTLTREDNNSSTNYTATDDGGGQWHLDKPGGLAAVKYTITATMTSPDTATFSRTGIQN